MHLIQGHFSGGRMYGPPEPPHTAAHMMHAGRLHRHGAVVWHQVLGGAAAAGLAAGVCQEQGAGQGLLQVPGGADAHSLQAACRHANLAPPPQAHLPPPAPPPRPAPGVAGGRAAARAAPAAAQPLHPLAVWPAGGGRALAEGQRGEPVCPTQHQHTFAPVCPTQHQHTLLPVPLRRAIAARLAHRLRLRTAESPPSSPPSQRMFRRAPRRRRWHTTAAWCACGTAPTRGSGCPRPSCTCTCTCRVRRAGRLLPFLFLSSLLLAHVTRCCAYVLHAALPFPLPCRIRCSAALSHCHLPFLPPQPLPSPPPSSPHPEAYASPEAAVLVQLYAALLNDYLSEARFFSFLWFSRCFHLA